MPAPGHRNVLSTPPQISVTATDAKDTGEPGHLPRHAATETGGPRERVLVGSTSNDKRSQPLRWARRLGPALIIAGALCFPGAAPVQAAGFDPNLATFGPGHAGLAFIPVDPGVLRAVGDVPARWGLQLNPAGKATLFFDTTTSPITVMGRTRPVVYEALFAVLDPSALPSPERTHDTSNFEGSPEDLYLISISVSDPGITDWLRDGTGLGNVVQYVPGLTSSLSLGVLQQYAFTAPNASPAPAEFVATVTDAFFPLSSGDANFWRETPEGTFRMDDSGNTKSLGFAQNWRLNTDPMSPLGLMVGGAERDFTCQPDGVAAPLLGVVTHRNDPGCIGSEKWSLAEWHKQIVVPRYHRPASLSNAQRTQTTDSRAIAKLSWRFPIGVILKSRSAALIKRNINLGDRSGHSIAVSLVRVSGQSDRLWLSLKAATPEPLTVSLATSLLTYNREGRARLAAGTYRHGAKISFPIAETNAAGVTYMIRASVRLP